MNGYVLSKWQFRGANMMFPLMLFGMFIPYQSDPDPAGAVAARDRVCTASISGLILVHVVYGIPITTLIFRNYYAEVPTEMVEAGAIDGAGFFGIYRHIILPLSMPGFVVVIIWQFTHDLERVPVRRSITSRPERRSRSPWRCNNLAGSQIVEWNVQMAGALLAALPTLLVYIVLGRYFIRGLLAGSIKG